MILIPALFADETIMSRADSQSDQPGRNGDVEVDLRAVLVLEHAVAVVLVAGFVSIRQRRLCRLLEAVRCDRGCC